MHDYCEKCSSNANETSGKNSSNSKKMYRKLPIYNLQLNLRLKILQFARIRSKSNKKNFTWPYIHTSGQIKYYAKRHDKKVRHFSLAVYDFSVSMHISPKHDRIAAAHHFFSCNL